MAHWIAKAVIDQERWIEEHGATLPGYVARYGSASSPNRYGDGGEAIYKADTEALAKLKAKVGPRR